MDDVTKDLTPEEEAKAQEAPKEDEVRANIIEKFGFDDDTESDKVDKMVETEMEHAKKLSSAISQKIKHRTAAEELKTEAEKNAKPPEDKPKEPTDAEALDKTLDEKLDERDTKRAIDDLDYPDELKDEIKRVAKIQEVSIKKVLEDPYIAAKVADYNKEQGIEEASISRKNNQGDTRTPSSDLPPDVDMGTEEGRKAHEDYKTAQKAKGK